MPFAGDSAVHACCRPGVTVAFLWATAAGCVQTDAAPAVICCAVDGDCATGQRCAQQHCTTGSLAPELRTVVPRESVDSRQVCTGGNRFCLGNTGMECSADGKSFRALADCGPAATCDHGTCTANAPAAFCGNGKCEPGEVAMKCSMDCTLPVVDPVPPGTGDVLPAGIPTRIPLTPTPRLQPLPPAWTVGRALQVHGAELLAIDADNARVVRIDRESLAVTATIPVGPRPDRMVIAADGTVFLTSRDLGAVQRIAPGQAIVNATWPVGTDPRGLALAPDGVLVVALAGEDSVVAMSPSGKIVGRADGIVRPRVVAIALDGMLYVTSQDERLWRQVLSMAFLDPILAPLLPDAAAPVPTATKALSWAFVPLQTAPNTVACTTSAGASAASVAASGVQAARVTGLAVDPDVGGVIASHVIARPGSPPQAGTEKGSSGDGYGGGARGSGTATCTGPVRPHEPALTRVQWSGPLGPPNQGVIQDPKTGRAFLTRFDQPADVVLHPTLTLAFVPATGSDNVLALNTGPANVMHSPIADLAVGDGPVAAAVAPDGTKLYTLDAVGFSISEVDLQPLLAVAAAWGQYQSTPVQFLSTQRSVVYGVDPLPAAARMGRRIFHSAANPRVAAAGRMACASCHMEGMQDSCVWFVAEGPRQTPALAGRLLDTAPFGWTSNKPTLKAHFQETTDRLQGSGLLPIEASALVAFLHEGLQPPPNRHAPGAGGLTAQQALGKSLFHDPAVGCAGCHAGPKFTDGKAYDVGTATAAEKPMANVAKAVGSFDTPSLLHLHATAPYLHDGSAPTLVDVLAKTAGKMGNVAGLSSGQRMALVAYLLTL